MSDLSNELPVAGPTPLTRAFKWATFGLTVLIVICAAWFGPEGVPFLDFSTEHVIQLITAAILVALFIERTTEVFLNAWRGGGKAALEGNLEAIRQKLKAAKVCEKEIDANPDVQALEAKLARFRTENQRMALLSGLILGIVASALGVRLISPLLDPRVIDELAGRHHSLLMGFDVLITGALLGGGANGLHKILDLFLSHVDAQRKKLRKDSPNPTE